MIAAPGRKGHKVDSFHSAGSVAECRVTCLKGGGLENPVLLDFFGQSYSTLVAELRADLQDESADRLPEPKRTCRHIHAGRKVR
jgi:hypothetical protein